MQKSWEVGNGNEALRLGVHVVDPYTRCRAGCDGEGVCIWSIWRESEEEDVVQSLTQSSTQANIAKKKRGYFLHSLGGELGYTLPHKIRKENLNIHMLLITISQAFMQCSTMRQKKKIPKNNATP